MKLLSVLKSVDQETGNMNSHKVDMLFSRARKIFRCITREFSKIHCVRSLALLSLAEHKVLQMHQILDKAKVILAHLTDELECIRFDHEDVSRELLSKISLQKRDILLSNHD